MAALGKNVVCARDVFSGMGKSAEQYLQGNSTIQRMINELEDHVPGIYCRHIWCVCRDAELSRLMHYFTSTTK